MYAKVHKDLKGGESDFMFLDFDFFFFPAQFTQAILKDLFPAYSCFSAHTKSLVQETQRAVLQCSKIGLWCALTCFS